MKNNKWNNIKRITTIALLIIITCCTLIGCDKLLGNNTTQPEGNPSNEQGNSSSGSSSKTYKKAFSVKDGYKIVDMGKRYVPERTIITKEEDKIVVERDPLWFICGPVVGLIGYFADTTKKVYPGDTYATKYYENLRVENELVWADTPLYFQGGNATLTFSDGRLTSKAVELSLVSSVSASTGISLDVFELGAEVTCSIGVASIVETTISKTSSKTYDLKGYESNKYYRVAIRVNYIAYTVEVRNSKNELIEKHDIIEFMENTIYTRLESSNNVDFT